MTETLAAEGDDVASRWIVLTPSVDDRAWRREIARAAAEAGLGVVDDAEDATAPLAAIRITDDASIALNAGASRIVALVPEPATAPSAVGDTTDLLTPRREWQASLLLSRALALAAEHSVITAEDLALKPAALTLFGILRLIPPVSGAELSRDPARAAAFQIYASSAQTRADSVFLAESIFNQDPRSAQTSQGSGVLDTTGRARLMIQGPFLHLPPGGWRASIRFAVDAAAAKRRYRFDWGTALGDYAYEYVIPDAAGTYELELDFVFSQVEEAEMRIFLVEGSFSGTLIFQGMSLRPIIASSN